MILSKDKVRQDLTKDFFKLYLENKKIFEDKINNNYDVLKLEILDIFSDDEYWKKIFKEYNYKINNEVETLNWNISKIDDDIRNIISDFINNLNNIESKY